MTRKHAFSIIAAVAWIGVGAIGGHFMWRGAEERAATQAAPPSTPPSCETPKMATGIAHLPPAQPVMAGPPLAPSPASGCSACEEPSPHVEALKAVLDARACQIWDADGATPGLDTDARWWAVNRGFVPGVMNASNWMVVTFVPAGGRRPVEWHVDLHWKTIADATEWKGWIEPRGRPVPRWPAPMECVGPSRGRSQRGGAQR
jgi:hypothetical protein